MSKPNIAALLEWAKDQKPAKAPKSRWIDYAPVVAELEGNGFTTRDAIRKLVEKGAIASDKERTAYHAILRFQKRQKAS